MEASWWERLTVGELGLVLIGGAILSKSLIQFSIDVQSYIPTLLSDVRPNYGRSNEDNGHLLQKVLCIHCYVQRPWPCSKPQSTHASTGDTWTLTGKSGSVSCGITAPFFWVLVHTRFRLCPPSLSPESCVSSVIKSPWPPKSNSLGEFLVPLRDPQDGKSVVGPRTFLTVWDFIWYNYSAVCGSSAQ